MQLISAGYENTKYFSNRFELQECGDFTWKVPDWCRHLRKNLGIKASNDIQSKTLRIIFLEENFLD
jgi:hypothetical protein